MRVQCRPELKPGHCEMNSPNAIPYRRPRRTRGGTELPRIDHRSVTARRFRALIDGFERDLGGGPLSVDDQTLIKQAAHLVLANERLQAEIASGQPVDADALVRVNSEARRAVSALRARAAKSKPSGASALQEYLAAKAAAAETESDDETSEVGDA
jgi:hypothetical protein